MSAPGDADCARGSWLATAAWMPADTFDGALYTLTRLQGVRPTSVADALRALTAVRQPSMLAANHNKEKQ